MLEWEMRLTTITERLGRKDRCKLKQLYYTLSTTAAEWIKNNQYGIKDGDIFMVENEVGAKCYFTFHEEYTELGVLSFLINPYIIVEGSDIQQGYRNLDIVEFCIDGDRRGIGTGLPGSFAWMLYNVKPGDTFSFEGRYTYCCLKLGKYKMKIVPIYTGDITRISNTTFSKMEPVIVEFYEERFKRDMYATNRINLSGAIVTKYTTGKYIDKYIDNIKSSMKPGETRKFKYGKIDVAIKRKKFDKKKKPNFCWYLGDEKVIEESIRVMMGYFNNATLEMSIEREEKDDLTEYYDMECCTRVKECGERENYRGVYREIVEYVAQNKGKVSINLKTFEPYGDGNYLSVCFDFKYEDNQVMVRKYYYDKNDFNKEVKIAKDVNLEEFIEFCNKVNQNNKVYYMETDYKRTYKGRDSMSEKIKLAEQIATFAHEGQVDKAGEAYINHPRTVSSMCETEESKIVGWLHDVVEDTEITLDDLKARGFSDKVIEAIRCVTKEEGYDLSEYYTRIKNNPIAREVKIADLTHNCDYSRIPEDAPEALRMKMMMKQHKYASYKSYLLKGNDGETLNDYLKRIQGE